MEVRTLFPLHLFADCSHFTHFLLDISGRNIAFTCTHLWNQTEEQLFDILGFPEIEPLTRVDGT